jgi:hypothetical protein
MLFNFRLRPLDQVIPWGDPEAPTFHWFGLSDGEYWIEAGGTTLFLGELKSFNDRLMAAMGERVEAVLNGALAPHIMVDLDGLATEHEKRRHEIEAALRSPEPPTDWRAIRLAIHAIETMTI